VRSLYFVFLFCLRWVQTWTFEFLFQGKKTHLRWLKLHTTDWTAMRHHKVNGVTFVVRRPFGLGCITMGILESDRIDLES